MDSDCINILVKKDKKMLYIFETFIVDKFTRISKAANCTALQLWTFRFLSERALFCYMFLTVMYSQTSFTKEPIFSFPSIEELYQTRVGFLSLAEKAFHIRLLRLQRPPADLEDVSNVDDTRIPLLLLKAAASPARAIFGIVIWVESPEIA